MKSNNKYKKGPATELRCSLCGNRLKDVFDIHNASPLKEDVCCTQCNYHKVIPYRISLAQKKESTNQ